MPIKELDVLIHPFYSSLHCDQKDMWKRRVDEIAKRPGHYLAIRGVSEWHFRRNAPRDEWEVFRQYAKEKLGDRFHAYKDDGNASREKSENRFHSALIRRINKIGFDPRRIKIHIYGTYVEDCLLSGIRLVPQIVPPSRVRKASRVILPLSISYLEGNLSNWDMKQPYSKDPSHPDVRLVVRDTYKEVRKKGAKS